MESKRVFFVAHMKYHGYMDMILQFLPPKIPIGETKLHQSLVDGPTSSKKHTQKHNA